MTDQEGLRVQGVPPHEAPGPVFRTASASPSRKRKIAPAGLAVMITLMIMLMFGMAALGQDVEDPSKPILDLLNRRFPDKVLQTNSELAPAVLMLSIHELQNNLKALNVDCGRNTVTATLRDGGTAVWACDAQPKRLPSGGLRQSYETQCRLSQSGVPTASFRVLVDRDGKAAAVRAEIGSPGADAIFVGTVLPKTTLKWIPVVAPEYVDVVRQATFIPSVTGSNGIGIPLLLGRYVFDSSKSVDSLIQYIDKQFTAGGLVPGMNLGADAFAAIGRGSNGALRIARFEALKLPSGKSRADLSFIEVPLSMLKGAR
jgi:hypothetical protein